MGGTSKQESTTAQSQQSQTNPWAPTQGLLTDIIGGVSGQMGNYTPNTAEVGALNTISQNAQNQPSYAPQAQQFANDLMAGGTDANSGILNNAYSDYQRQLSPIANQNNDPMAAPGMAALLNTIKSDVSNSVNGMFAGAGRDLSGANVETLARGLSSGMAGPLLAQYNQNVQNKMGAAGNLFGAGGATAQGLQGFDQQGFQNRALGLDTAINGVPAAQNAGAMGILNAESLARNLPIQNLAQILGLTLPIAGLGSQSSGSGTSNTNASNTMSGAQQFQTIASGIGSLMPKNPMSFSFGGG